MVPPLHTYVLPTWYHVYRGNRMPLYGSDRSHDDITFATRSWKRCNHLTGQEVFVGLQATIATMISMRIHLVEASLVMTLLIWAKLIELRDALTVRPDDSTCWMRLYSPRGIGWKPMGTSEEPPCQCGTSSGSRSTLRDGYGWCLAGQFLPNMSSDFRLIRLRQVPVIHPS